MNFGLDDIINKTVLGTPVKDLDKLAEELALDAPSGNLDKQTTHV